jgi:hypothetical protein
MKVIPGTHDIHSPCLVHNKHFNKISGGVELVLRAQTFPHVSLFDICILIRRCPICFVPFEEENKSSYFANVEPTFI